MVCPPPPPMQLLTIDREGLGELLLPRVSWLLERESQPRHSVIVALETLFVSVRADENELEVLPVLLHFIVGLHQLWSKEPAGATLRWGGGGRGEGERKVTLTALPSNSHLVNSITVL